MGSQRDKLKFLLLFAAIFSLLSAAVLADAQTLQPLLQFKGVTNGGEPSSAPISDASGNLYGTTVLGGDGACNNHGAEFGCGTVYELSPPTTGTGWTETLLYQFQGAADGKSPYGGLVMDRSGNLYGTTTSGGSSSSGTVFELSPPASGTGPWTITTIYNFNGFSSGGGPWGAPAIDKLGNLYGTTYGGGPNCSVYGGCNGVVYKLSPPAASGGSWTEKTIYTFQGVPDAGNSESPLTFDSSGNLYGTSLAGGSQACGLSEGCGTVFELSPPASSGGAWTEKVLYAFTGQPNDGYSPLSAVIFDSTGSVYGTAVGGGVVYKLTPPTQLGGPWTESLVYGFGPHGPFGSVVFGKDGSLYGTTWNGGSYYWGSVFQLSPPAVSGDPWVETTLYGFTSPSYLTAGLIFGPQGWLYGVTDGDGLCYTSSSGSHYSCGAVFRIRP